MAINNDRNLLEQQILSNSGLKGKELENLRARLATLSEQQLQAELSKSLSGNNKGEWYTGVMLEHNESVIMRNNHDQTSYTDDNGNEISELKDGDEVLERTIKSTDDKGNVFETTVTFSGGRPLTQTKTKNGNTTETTTYKYNDDAEVPFVTVQTKKADQSKVMTNVLEVDENGNFNNEDFIDRQTTSMDGTTTHIFTENNCVIEQQVKPNGKKIDTIYKGDSIEDYDNKKLHRVYQRTELKGEVHEVAYDGNGNTRTVVQNGESPSAIARKFGVKESSLRKLNPARGKNAITQVGADIVVPGEYDADSRTMRTRKTKQGALNDYANDEVGRVAERLYSSSMQEVTLDRDYKDAYGYARALLAADGVKNPSNEQINNKANEILVANGNIKFKKGTKVQIASKTADSKFVAELSNNGFKPTRENAIFYNRFNALNPTQQQNVLSVIKYCKSQNITDPNKIKARILETFPEINLFDSGKTVSQNDFTTPAYQRKNPVALETFLTETLKLDLKSDVGQRVYNELAQKSQAELNLINAQNFGDLSKANFNEIADKFESSGVNIRTQLENQIEQANRAHREERLGIPQQKFTSEMLANIYDRAADMMEEYYHNHGVLDAGTYLEGMKNLMDWITPDNLFGIDMRSTLHVASDCRKAAQRFRQMHTDNPETFKREYEQLKKDGLVTADYNKQNVQEFMNLIQSGEVDINSDKFKNACQKAFGFKGVENTEKYIQTGQMAGNIGDIAVMLYTLGAASELKMMGKATQGVYGALEKGAGRIMSKTAAQKTAKIGTSMAMGGTTLGGFTLGKETLNNLSNPMRDATSWETWKETGIASAESFGFGAFGGLLNETVVAPIVKAIEKPATKATQAVSKALTEQGELTGKQIMQTVSESGGLKLDGLFKMNSQELANLARTATAKGVGFGAEVTGFTAYEAGLDVIKDLIDPKTGRLPDNIDVKYLCDKFGEQLSNLGTIKGVSMFLMMRKGGKVAQKAMLNEFLSESEALKNIKFKKAEINGHEVYEVTYPNGNRAVVSSPEQAIATCQMAMQMEFLAKSLSEVETPKGRLNDVREASATNPAENAEAKILSEVARTEFKDEGMRLNTPESLDAELAEAERNPNTPVDNLETLSLVINGKLGETLKSQYEKAGQVFEEIITKNADKIAEMEKKYSQNQEQFATEFTQLLSEQLGVKGIEPKIRFVEPKDEEAGGYFDWTTGELLISNKLKNPKDVETIIAHEFVHVMQFKDIVAAKGQDGVREIYLKNNGGKFIEGQARKLLADNGIDYDSLSSEEQAQYRDVAADILAEQTLELNAGLTKFAQEHPLEKGSLNEYLSRIYQAENENMATFDTPEYYSQVIENEAYFLGNGRTGAKINADTKIPTDLTKRTKPQGTSEDGVLVPAGTLPKTENMTKQEFMSYINTLELTQSVAGKDVKYKWTTLLNSEEMKELGDLYEKHPELVSDLIKNRVANLQKNQYCYADEIIGIVKAYEEYGEPVKTLMDYSFQNANGEDSKFEALSIKSILRRPDKDFIIECLQNPDSKIKSLLKTMVDTAQMPNNKFIENLKILDKNYDELIKDKNNEVRINETIDELSEAVKKFDIDAYKIAQEKMFDLYDLTLPKTREGVVNIEQAEEAFNQMGVGSHSISKILEIYGDKVPQKVIDFAQEFYNTDKISFSEYGTDEEISTKSRTLKTALKLSTDKTGNTNIEELNKIIGFLTKDGHKIYINDLLNYLRYGKNSDGIINLETVKKVKSLMQPGADVLVEVRNGIKEIRDQFENTESFDYEAYNKVLNSINSPLEVGQMLNIIKATRQNANARKSFMDNPAEYLKYVQNRFGKGKLMDYANINNIPVVEYDAEILKQLNEVYEIESISGATAERVKVTPENMETVKMLLNQNKNYNNDEIADLVSAYESAPDLFNKIYNENITPDEELFLEYTCRKYNSESGLRLFIEKGFSFDNVNNLNPVVTDCLSDAGQRCTEAQIDLLCKISNTAKELEITPKVMRMISKIDPKDPQAIIDIIECFPEKIDELYLGRLQDLLGNTSPEKLTELKKLISERKDDIKKAQLNLTYTLSYPERALDILDGTGLYEKPMTRDEFIDEICTLAGRPRDAIQEEHMDDIIDMYNKHYMLDPVLMSEIFAKDSEGQYVHTQTFIAGTLMDNAIDITNKKLIHKLILADKTLKKPDMEYDPSIGVSKTEFEFLKATAKYFGEEGYRYNNISETIENFDNEISQRIATEILNNSESGITSVLPKSINNIKTEAEADRFLNNFSELKQKYREYNKNNLAEEALVINTPEMKQLCEDLHKNYPNLARISNLLRIAQEGGYEKIRHMIDNPTEQNVQDLKEMHDQIYWEAMDNVVGLNIFKLDLKPQQLLSLAGNGHNLKGRHLLDSDNNLSAQDIYDMAYADNDTYYKTFPKYSHLLGKMPASTIMHLRENLDGYIEKGLLDYGLNSATMLDYFDKNPEELGNLKQNKDYQIIAKYSGDPRTYHYLIRKPNSDGVNWVKDIDAILNASGNKISGNQRDLIKTVTEYMKAAINAEGENVSNLMNLDIAKDLCINFEKYGLNVAQTLNIIRNSNQPLINKLLYDKELNFPKEFIADIITNMRGGSIDKQSLAEKLCYEKECSPQLISGILKATRDNTIDLVNRLCFDKELNFPKEMIKPLVETIFAKDNAKITEILVEGMQNTKLTPTDIIRVQDLIDSYRSKHMQEFDDLNQAQGLINSFTQRGLLEITPEGKPIFKQVEVENVLKDISPDQPNTMMDYVPESAQQLITEYLTNAPHQRCANEMVRFVREKNQILNAIKGTVKDSNPEFVEFAEKLLNTNESDFLFNRKDYHKNKLLTDIMGTYKLISYIDERPQDYLNGNYKEEIITALKEIRSYKTSDKPTYEKLSDVEKQIVQGLNEDIEAYIGKNKLEILKAVSIADTETVKLFLDKRFHIFRGKINEITSLSEDKQIILADIMRNGKRQNSLGQPDKLTGQQKVDMINLINAYNGTIEDFNKYKTPLKGRAYMLDIEQLQKDILSDVLKENGMSEEEINKIDFSNVNWDLRYVSLLTRHPHKDEGELSEVIRESTKGNFQNYIKDSSNPHGKANEMTQQKFAQHGVNYNAWTIGPKEQKFNIGGVEYTVKLWNRDPQESLFDGSYTTCCTALDHTNGGSMANYLLNTAINVVEIKDASGQTVGMSRCYIGELDGVKTLVMENIEVNNGLISEMTKEHTTCELTQGLFNYMNNFADMVLGEGSPVYLSTSYHKIGEEGFRGMPLQSVKETKLLGNISKSSLYLNTHAGYVDVKDGTVETKPASFHVVRKKAGLEE